jgi:hypothetical protein
MNLVEALVSPDVGLDKLALLHLDKDGHEGKPIMVLFICAFCSFKCLAITVEVVLFTRLCMRSSMMGSHGTNGDTSAS